MAAGGAAQRPGEKPNIVFIMADDLGYGDLGCFGQELIRTPNIDRMAAEGTRFTDCYAGAAVCAPSRCVLMTGLHTGHARIRNNSPAVGGVVQDFDGKGRRLPLEDSDVTVAEVLKRAGYATGITGKWGLGEPGTAGVPTRQGFDEWYGYLNQDHAVYYYTDYLWRNETRQPIEANKGGTRGAYTHDLFTGFALDFIRGHRSQPFFLYTAYTIPHFDLEVPDLEPYTDRPWPEASKKFASMITRLDRDVGRIFALLKELSLDKNTLVFFCSDNGSPEGGGKMFQSVGPFSGRKGRLNEGGIRTPMIARWPGKVPAGRVSDSVWYFADVLPTLAGLAGVAPPANIDGMDVAPTLLGRQQNLSDRYLYWEVPSKKMQQAARQGRYKALRPAPGAPLELYDLKTDSAEKHDLAGKRPEVLARFEEYLRTARTESPHWPTGDSGKS